MSEAVLIHPGRSGPRSQCPAPGLASLAAVLEKAGLGVTVIDMAAQGLDRQDTVQRVARLNPAVIGLSCLSSYRFETFDLAHLLKQKNPRWKVVVGGPHVSFLDEITLGRIAAIDCVVRGEGEETLLEYLRAVLAQGPLEAVAGITFREGGRIVRTQDRPLLEDLDSLPFPAYHLFPDLSHYGTLPDVPRELEGLRHAPVVSSRGCPYRCLFCSSSEFWGKGRRFRARSAGNVVDEMAHLQARYGVEYIRFFDDNFTASKSRVHQICDELLRRGMKLKWRAEARVDGVDREMLEKMAAAGCHLLEYGVETASPRVMERTNKRIDLGRIPEVVRLTRRAGMQAKAFFIVGMPGERLEDFALSLRASRHFDFLGVLPLLIFPGSPLHQTLVASGRFNDETWFRRNGGSSALGLDHIPLFTESFDPDCLERMVLLLHACHAQHHRLARLLQVANLTHPRRSWHLVRSVWQAHRKLAAEARSLGLDLPRSLALGC